MNSAWQQRGVGEYPVDEFVGGRAIFMFLAGKSASGGGQLLLAKIATKSLI